VLFGFSGFNALPLFLIGTGAALAFLSALNTPSAREELRNTTDTPSREEPRI
jgi:hypothetical protein